MPRLASPSRTAASRSHRAVPVVARAVTTLLRSMFPPDVPVAAQRESRRPSLPLSRRLSQTAMRRDAEDGLARQTQPPSSRQRPLPRLHPSRQAGEAGLASSPLRLPSLTRRTTMKNSLMLWVKVSARDSRPMSPRKSDIAHAFLAETEDNDAAEDVHDAADDGSDEVRPSPWISSLKNFFS